MANLCVCVCVCVCDCIKLFNSDKSYKNHIIISSVAFAKIKVMGTSSKNRSEFSFSVMIINFS